MAAGPHKGLDVGQVSGVYTQDVAVNRLKAAKDIIKTAKEAGLDVSDLEAQFASAKPMLQRGDWKGAYDVAEAVLTAIKARIEALESGGGGEGGKAGGGPEGAPATVPAEPKHVVKVKKVRKVGIDKNAALSVLKEAKAALSEARASGINVDDLLERFKSTKAYLDSGDYSSAAAIGREVMAELENRRGVVEVGQLAEAQPPEVAVEAPAQAKAQGIEVSPDFVDTAFDRYANALQAINEFGSKGMDVSQLEERFNMSREAFANDDYATAESTLIAVEQELQQLQQLASGQGGPEVMAMGGVEVGSAQVESAEVGSAQIEGAMGGSAQIESAEVATTVQAGKVEEWKESEVVLEEPGITPEEAKKHLSEAKRRMKEAKDSGLDITMAQEEFLKARPLLQNGDYEGAYKVALNVLNIIETMPRPIAQGAEAGVETPEEAAVMAGVGGGEVSTFQPTEEVVGSEAGVREGAEEAATEFMVSQGGAEAQPLQGEVGGMGAGVEPPAEGAVEAPMGPDYNDAMTAIQAAKAALQNLKSQGVDISELRDVLVQTKSMLGSGDYAGVVALCGEVERRAEELKSTAVVNTVNSKIMEFEENLSELRNEGADVDALAQDLENLKGLASQSKWQEAVDLINTLEPRFNDIMDQYMGKKATSMVLDLQSQVASAQDAGVDLKDVLPLFEEMKAAYEAKRYGETLSLARQVNNGLKNARMKGELLALLKEAKAIIDEAKTAGAEVSHAENIFNMAKPAVKQKDFEKAMEYGLRAKKEAEQALLQHRVFTLVQDIQTLITQATNLGLGLGNIVENFQRTKDLLEEEDFEGALAMGKQTQAEINNLLERYNEAKGRMEAIEADISDMKAKGIRAPMAESLVEEAKKALGIQDYTAFDEVSSRITRMLEDAKKRYEEAFEAVNRAQAKITEAKKIGAATKEAEVIFANVAQALDEANYDEAIEYARQAEESAILSKQRYERAFDVVSLAQKQITEAKKIGADVSQAMEFMRQISAALDDGDYDRAMEFARKAETEAENAKRRTEQIVDMIQMAKTKIETFKRKGVDVSEGEKYFQQMIAAIDRNDYDEAMRLGETTLENLERARLVHEQLVEEIRTTQKQITEAKSLGIDIARAMAIFNQIPTARNTGDLARAISLAKEARSKVEEALKKYQALQKIQETYQRVNDAKKIGSDVSVSEEMLSQARAALKLEDYDGAIRLAKQAAQELAARLLGQSASEIATTPGSGGEGGGEGNPPSAL